MSILTGWSLFGGVIVIFLPESMEKPPRERDDGEVSVYTEKNKNIIIEISVLKNTQSAILYLKHETLSFYQCSYKAHSKAHFQVFFKVIKK